MSCSTASLLGVTGVLAPLLEETIFRGFLMVALTKWYVDMTMSLPSRPSFIKVFTLF